MTECVSLETTLATNPQAPVEPLVPQVTIPLMGTKLVMNGATTRRRCEFPVTSRAPGDESRNLHVGARKRLPSRQACARPTREAYGCELVRGAELVFRHRHVLRFQSVDVPWVGLGGSAAPRREADQGWVVLEGH